MAQTKASSQFQQPHHHGQQRPTEVVVDLPAASLYSSVEQAEPALTSEGRLVIFDFNQNGLFRAQVGEVYWTLSKHEATCMRVNERTFSFALRESPGLYLTVVLPQDATSQALEHLESVLQGITTFYKPGTAPSVQTDATVPSINGDLAAKLTPYQTGVAGQISKAGQAGQRWVEALSAAVSQGLMNGAEYLTQQPQRLAPVSQPVHVSESTLKRLETARSASSKVASLTGKVAGGMAGIVVSAASRATTNLTHAASSYNRQLKSAGIDTSGITYTVVAGITAIDEVLQALQDAGTQVARVAATAASTVVQHRYGTQAAEASRLAMGSAVHFMEAQRNLGLLRPTRIAKETAKKTARQIAREHAERHAAYPSGPTSVVIEELPQEEEYYQEGSDWKYQANGKPNPYGSMHQQNNSTAYMPLNPGPRPNVQSSTYTTVPEPAKFYPAVPSH